jgi:hypothetical protein
MNKLYILLLLLLVFAGRAIGQENAKILMGKSYPFIESRHQFYIADKSGFLIIKLWSKQVILQKIGPDLTLQKVMQYENFPKDFTVEKVLEIKGRYYILYSSTAKDVISFFAAQVDVTKGELMDGGKEIATTTKEIEKQSLRFMIADDSSRFSISYRIKSGSLNKSKSFEEIGIWVFNNQLIEQWHNEFKLPYPEKKCNVRGRGIDTDGKVHIVLSVINDDSGLEKKTGQDTPNYTLEILTFQSATSPPSVTPFSLNGKFLHSLSINGSSQRLTCSGYYNWGQMNDNPEGVFMVEILLGASSKTNLHPFPISLVNEYEGKMKQKQNENKVKNNKSIDMDDLTFVDSTVQPDGGLLIQGEEQTAGTGGYTAPATPGGSGPMVYGGSQPTSGNIILVRLLPDGKLAWARKLSKGQLTPLTNALPYQYSNKIANRHDFFFLEDELKVYRINDATGIGEKEVLTKLKPLLKKPAASYAIFPERLLILTDGKSVVFEARMSGDAGKFGETKPYKEEVLVKVIID